MYVFLLLLSVVHMWEHCGFPSAKKKNSNKVELLHVDKMGMCRKACGDILNSEENLFLRQAKFRPNGVS